MASKDFQGVCLDDLMVLEQLFSLKVYVYDRQEMEEGDIAARLCKARVRTDGELKVVMSAISEHNHDMNERKIESKQLRVMAKQKASNSVNPKSIIYETFLLFIRFRYNCVHLGQNFVSL
jgi:hypothetical protein